MALTAGRNTKKMGTDAVISLVEPGVEASTHIYQGGLTGVDANGYAVPATPGGSNPPIAILGRAEREADNSGTGTSAFSGSGVAGSIACQIQRGVFKWANGSGVDAISAANIGQTAYAIDDQTVGLTAGTVGGSVTANRVAAGRIIQVDSDGVWVESGALAPQGGGPVDVVFPANGALAAGKLVKLNSSGKLVLCVAGDPALGVLVNSPGAANAAGIVRIFGFHPAVLADGTIGVGAFFEADASGLAVACASTLSSGNVTAGERIGVALTAGAASGSFAAFIFPRGIPAGTQA
ncbi:MAG TPA: hypothetical protein VMB50_20790 [Myxococcales bacterium]|nr:hypothetical protein [Myxococcales bacterium]